MDKHTEWETSRDAVPEGITQITVYDTDGKRIATVFDEAAAQLIVAVPGLVEALRRLPDDVDMIEYNPDEGQSFFCCGAETSINHGRMEHATNCWYVAARAALAKAEGET